MIHNNNPSAGKAGIVGTILIIVLIVAAGIYFINTNRGSDGDSKFARAAEEFGDNAEHGRILEGIEEGSEELQDRSTGEKIGDAIEDAGRDLQDAAKEE